MRSNPAVGAVSTTGGGASATGAAASGSGAARRRAGSGSAAGVAGAVARRGCGDWGGRGGRRFGLRSVHHQDDRHGGSGETGGDQGNDGNVAIHAKILAQQPSRRPSRVSSSLLTSRRQRRQGPSRHQAAREQRHGVDETDAPRKPAQSQWRRQPTRSRRDALARSLDDSAAGWHRTNSKHLGSIIRTSRKPRGRKAQRARDTRHSNNACDVNCTASAAIRARARPSDGRAAAMTTQKSANPTTDCK